MDFFNSASYSYINSIDVNAYQSNYAVPNQSFDPAYVLYREPFVQNISKTDDELWIETWLSKIGKIHINLDSTVEIITSKSKCRARNDIPIHIAKNYFKSCLEILSKLNKIKNELQTDVEIMPRAVWKEKILEIGHLKESFTKIMNIFDNNDNMLALKRAVNQRRKKRRKQKMKKEVRRLHLKHEEEIRIKKHKDIDAWLEKQKEETERVKSEENIKKDADCVLAEVTKKKTDAKRLLALITSLVKLRSVRENMAIQRGEKISLSDKNAFSVTTEKLFKLWEQSLKSYSDEEHALKTMLEKNASEDMKARKLAKERDIILSWENVIFGPKTVISPENITYWALTAAERDLETFVAIRKSWDTFLKPPIGKDGTSIPLGWVLPPSTPTENWAKFLKH